MLIPYAQIDGSWSVSDTLIRDLWQRLEECGVARATFRSGEVRTADDFVAMVKHPSNIPVFVAQGSKLIGVAWLNDVRRNSAFSHFAYSREAWGQTKEIGQSIIDYWFSLSVDDEPVLEVLIGNIPDCNRHALKYVDKLGFTRLGTIPRISNGNGMVVHYLERNDG